MRRGRLGVWVFLALLSAIAHLLLLIALEQVGFFSDTRASKPAPALSLVLLQPKVEEEAEVPEPEKPDESGQIVELPPPKVEEIPKEAEYLAEHNHRVDEETRTENTKINPEVLAPQYSREAKVQLEEAADVQATDPATGAKIGNDRFDPDRNGSLAALPSPWRLTNREGLDAPVPASALAATLAGAPQNDLLNEARGDKVALNAHEFMYAAYLNRIRRAVNFYWEQNLDNLSKREPLVKPKYKTEVRAVLDRDGALIDALVIDESGSHALDQAVLSAFRLAGPFPDPPSGIIEEDGRIHLPDMGFTVVLGQAQNQFQGVDPRAGVQYPGLLKSPR